MTRGCQSSHGAILLSSLDAILQRQKHEQGSAVTKTAEKGRKRDRARKTERRRVR